VASIRFFDPFEIDFSDSKLDLARNTTILFFLFDLDDLASVNRYDGASLLGTPSIPEESLSHLVAHKTDSLRQSIYRLSLDKISKIVFIDHVCEVNVGVRLMALSMHSIFHVILIVYHLCQRQVVLAHFVQGRN